MNSFEHLLNKFEKACEKFSVAQTQFILIVSIAEQAVSLFEQNKFVKTFPCSTSRFGIGQTEGSNRMPLGLHRIAEKIGAGEPAGTVFRSYCHFKASPSCSATGRQCAVRAGARRPPRGQTP